MAGDLGLECLTGCWCFLYGMGGVLRMGVTLGVEVRRVGVIDCGAIVESLGVTGFGAVVGDIDMTGFSGTVLGRLDFGDSSELTISPSDRVLSERERSCFNWSSVDWANESMGLDGLGGLALEVVDSSVSKVVSTNSLDFGAFLGFGAFGLWSL